MTISSLVSVARVNLLALGSAASDRGINAGIFTGVNGDARPLDAGFDIGMDEHKQSRCICRSFCAEPSVPLI